VITALFLVGSNDGGAAAKPAEGLTEWQMEIERKVASNLMVSVYLFEEDFPSYVAGEMGGGRVGSIARRGHVVFLYQLEIDFKHAHLDFARWPPGFGCIRFAH